MNAAITVDLDTLNDYAYTYGINHVDNPDLVYTRALPRLIPILKKNKIKATFFVVGRDLNIPEHLKLIKDLKSDGHEIANHSYSHRHNFDKLGKDVQKKEILDCHKIVQKKLKIKMVGFRAPGYNISDYSLDILAKKKYLYDSSMFPTLMLPALKLATVLVSRGKFKSTGGGRMISMFGKMQPHVDPIHGIVEIPISVTPIVRIPFMGTFNLITNKRFFLIGIKLLRSFSRDINYEFHPIELLDFKKDKLPAAFKRHPGSMIPVENKINFYNMVLSEIKKNHAIILMKDLAKGYLKRK